LKYEKARTIRHRLPALARDGAGLYSDQVAGQLGRPMGTPDVTALLEAANRGDANALKAAFAQVYGELKQLARQQLASSSTSTLDTTGLLHEAYLKLTQQRGYALHDRSHFFAIAARAMRQIVIDHARARLTEKRGRMQAQVVDLEEASDVAGGTFGPEELLRLEHAMARLEDDEPRLASLVDMRFFAGLGVAEIAKLQDVTERTVSRDWRRAKAILYEALYPDA
jgi:RNA polymerase sigma factor (TIGR02999 family)